ncbi:MAG: MBL fold metallo-hydrolase [Bosea sp. (in: a-proteobacteria)]
MSDALTFDHAFADPPGTSVQVSPLVRRMVAPNKGPFTFTGTCSDIVGRGTVAIIDPGPDDAGHIAALLEAVRGETVSHIFVSHTHRDHSPAVPAIRAATGAQVVGCGPHRMARQLALGEINLLDASSDHAFKPDRQMQDGDAVAGPGWTLEAVETPGHTTNHLAFALSEEQALFSADHVMAWSTTIVAPPDGSMAEYMASLEKLRARDETIYWPGHGGPVTDPQRFLRGLLHHRRQREVSILNQLGAGAATITAIVPLIYQGLAPALHGAAALSVYAHLEDMVARGLVRCDTEQPSLSARYQAT